MVYDRIRLHWNIQTWEILVIPDRSKHTKTDVDFGYMDQSKTKWFWNCCCRIKFPVWKWNSMVWIREDPELAGEISALYNELGKLRWKLNGICSWIWICWKRYFSSIRCKQIERPSIKAGMKFKVTNFETKKVGPKNTIFVYKWIYR